MSRVISDLFDRREPSSVTTFYNGDCPICDAEIDHYRRLDTLPEGELLWRDLADYPEALRCFGVSQREARRRMHVIDRDGRLQVGLDAFLTVWAELPRYRWLVPPLRLRPIHWLVSALYDHIMVPRLEARNLRRAGSSGDAVRGGRHAE